jgi:hypothetical protein
MSEWDEFGDRLASTFRQVTGRVFLIIASEADPARYVQFAGQDDRLDAEAPATDVVADADESALKESGWTAPNAAQPNWSSSLQLPALASEYKALAARCVVALRDAYGITSPDDLGYRAWREAERMPEGVTWSAEQIERMDRGVDSLDLPGLGLASS